MHFLKAFASIFRKKFPPKVFFSRVVSHFQEKVDTVAQVCFVENAWWMWWRQASTRLPSQCTLRWRHNGREGVSNHQPRDCLLNHLFKPQIKENIQIPRHWPLWGEYFHLMTSSWVLSSSVALAYRASEQMFLKIVCHFNDQWNAFSPFSNEKGH